VSEKQIESDTEQNKAGYHSRESTPVQRPEVQIPKAIVDRYDASQKETHRRETLSSFFQGMTLVIVAAYTALTYQQWQAILQQNQNAQRALEISQRSHFGITHIEMVSDKPDELGARFTFDNQGGSPSSDVTVKLNITVADNTPAGNRTVVDKTLHFGQFPFLTGTSYNSTVIFDGFTNDDWRDVLAGKKTLVIGGSLQYSDGFTFVKGDGFCFRALSSDNWDVCPVTDFAHLNDLLK
jgi:hypothetical protein